ncbi:hypothetical protein FYK55_23825 [Roseiconus nitratireducens]|uniref:Aerotolerance regulator N-terminal domain-containing protein n=1 Tax=Roseiconus nitratireducens TaxID=2605748 RepID=A0A5M6CYV0_9BACT|nr:BatA domain-containing protein [Roseiconus nitratireducens]KAA5539600.1 hypothetical protein FYK55_23825 [Roseiconus nitratireducens]
MTFLNASLLFALAAIGIPIALHLIARKEPRQVLFPSVRLLTQRLETNRSKMRVRRWWLLALRILALAAVAVALAQPAIAGSLSLTWTTIGILAAAGVALLGLASVAASHAAQKSLVWSLLAMAGLVLAVALTWSGYTLASGTKPVIDERGPVALTIVIDNGPLSAWQTSETNHLQQLRSAATELIASAGAESRIAVIDRSTTPAAFALDRSGAISKVNDLRPLEMAQPLDARIEAAARLLETSQIDSRQLVLLSGLAESAFSDSFADQSLADLIQDAGIGVTIWQADAYRGANRSLSLPTLSDDSPAPEAPIKVAATVSLRETTSEDNESGDQPSAAPPQSRSTTAECVLYPRDASLPVVRNGDVVRPEPQPVDRVSVPLAPGRDVELQMTLPPLEVGLHHGAIRLVGEDPLAIDDACYFSVEVLPPNEVLLVGDQSEEADEIARTISAPAEVNDPTAQFRLQRISYADLGVSRLQDYDGVILLDPPSAALGDPALKRYLQSGGSVLVTVGRQLGTTRVDEPGFPIFQRPWRVNRPGTFLEISSPSHPALQNLAAIPEGVPFPDFRIDQYWQTQPRDGDRVLMRYAGTGHPALIESAAEGGEGGRLLVLTTPIPELADPAQAWNELFSAEEFWPAFLLVRDLTDYLTRRGTETWTFRVGTPVSIVIEQSTPEQDPRRLQWFPPDVSTPIPVDVPATDSEDTSSERRIVIGRPERSGVHWIRGDRVGLGFTVNVPRDGLDPAAIDPSQLDEWFGSERVRRIETLTDMDWTSGSERQSVSLWSPVMLLALIVFLLEQILGNRFYRRRAGPQRATAAAGSAA